MSHPGRLALLVAAAALSLTAARAELEWQRTSVEVTAKSTDTSAIAEYRFKNTGVDDVTIRAVHPDCGCVTVPLEKTTYAPGEEGRLVARFDVGDQPIDRQIPIHLQTESAGRKANAVLILRAQIHEVVRFSPKQLYWRINDTLEPKTVTVTLDPSEHMSLKEAKSETTLFKVGLTPTDDPNTFRLEITPPNERARAVGTIIVTTTAEDRPEPLIHRMIVRVL